MTKNRFLTMETYLKSDGVGFLAKKERKTYADQQSRIQFSRPFYDTGEHVLAGQVDKHPVLDPSNMLDIHGVLFNYGQLITMADLYQTYDDMIVANPKELERLRELIRQGESAYKRTLLKMTGESGVNPGHDDWQTATNKRYSKLAIENYAHFAPKEGRLYKPGNLYKGREGTNRSSWEYYHQRAIENARKKMTPEGLKESYNINAFGDHFLTDAFSAGHIMNKDDISNLFKSKMINKGSISSAGKDFFNKVALKVFYGPVGKAFEQYETTGPPLLYKSIDNHDIFALLLIKIMEQEPDMIGKTAAANAVHGYLNSYRGGLPVKNKYGTEWKLTGDGRLNMENLEMIRKAVTQSVTNIDDAVKNPSEPIESFFKKVWDFVPRVDILPAGKKIVDDAVKKFTDPASPDLFKAAVDMINAEYPMIIDELVDRKKLQPVGSKDIMSGGGLPF